MRFVFFCCLLVLAATLPARADPWLFVSDIHLNPRSTSSRPARTGTDTNVALLRSAIAEMQRVDPQPPVIVIGGDYLAHNFDYSRANATMIDLAQRFNRAFPHAQFVIALGNEDSGCGDYALATNSGFLRAVAAAWQPLVNRHGAAPSFARTFVRDGFYTASLPIRHLRVVVIDDVYWAPRYRACASGLDGSAATTAELRAALLQRGESHWVLAHIPPGIDAWSTAHLAHHLVVVPFLDPGRSEEYTAMLADPAAHVELLLAAHSHKFAYRFIARAGRAPVPILQIPSISPIFANAPAFLTVDVSATGIIESADDHAFLHHRWRTLGGTRSLGLRAYTGEQLAALHRRFEHDAPLRATYALLYDSGASPEITAANWRTYWCSAAEFSATTFRACLAEPGLGIFTSRGIVVVAALAAGVLAALFGAGLALVRSRQRRVSVP